MCDWKDKINTDIVELGSEVAQTGKNVPNGGFRYLLWILTFHQLSSTANQLIQYKQMLLIHMAFFQFLTIKLRLIITNLWVGFVFQWTCNTIYNKENSIYRTHKSVCN
jgi:hypothetical protein